MPSPPVSREEFHGGIDSLRSEFQAGLTTAGVQMGAVEKTLKAQLSSLRAWGVAALIGGQTVAAIAAKFVGGPTPGQTVAYVVHLFS